MITGAAFVDLCAAYDTVNHRILIQKLYNTTLDSQLYKVFQNMLSNRRFYVEQNNERSRWIKQKNGLPQLSSHQSCSTFTLMISQSTMERVTSYTQMISGSPPSTLHSQKYNLPLEMHWTNSHSITDPTVCVQTLKRHKLLHLI